MSASAAHSGHLRGYFLHSVAATGLMLAVPLAVVWLCSEVLFYELPTLPVLFVSLASGLLCSILATWVWERRSRTAEISFSELMIWSWYRLQKAERNLEKGLRESDNAQSHQGQLQVLFELNRALESKDPYTRGHSRRVERYSFMIGVEMGLPLEDLETLRMAASLHDVGKYRIPNQILHKPGRLSDDERALVETHPVVGSEMVDVIGNQQIVATVRHHHERWDGAGYPDGIEGTEIPVFARVIAVADSYDAIRSNRSYRPGASRDEAVSIIGAESGHQYDPDVVEAFMATLPARNRFVAALMSLTGPGALWRFLWQLFQRFGSTGLAPVLGAVGAGFLIVTSTFVAPAAPAVAGPAPVEAVIPDPSIVPDPIVGAGADRATTAARAERRRSERRDARIVARKDGRGGGSEATTGGSSNSGTTATSGSNSGTASGSGTQNDGSTATTDPSSGASGDQGSSAVSNPAGKDCDPGLGKPSKGSRNHCS